MDSATSAAQPRKNRFLAEITAGKVGGVVDGRVQTKSTIKHWAKGNESGKLFNFVLSDSTAEINVVASGERVDEFYDKVKVGECVRISAFKTRPANKQYQATDHEYELQLTKVN